MMTAVTAAALLGSLLWTPPPKTPARCAVAMKADNVVNEFSRTVSVATLGRKATRSALSATPEECAALAKRFDLDGIGSLDANVSLAIVDPKCTRVRAYGSLSATSVAQPGGTLQVDAAPFEYFFVDEDLAAAGGAYKYDDDETYDEPIEEGQIDIGELVAQHFFLWLSEYEQAQFREASSEFEPGEVAFEIDVQ